MAQSADLNRRFAAIFVGPTAGTTLVRVLLILVAATLLVGVVVKLGDVIEAMRLPWP